MYLLLLLINLVSTSDDNQYLIRYEVFEGSDYGLEISKQLAGDMANGVLALHYVHDEYELLYLNGESSFYDTGISWYPDSLNGIYNEYDWNKNESVVYKNHKNQQTKQENTMYPGVCRIFSHSEVSESWVITTEVTQMQGLLVQKAYQKHDYNRVAWFAPGIPISDGPFNTSGLPGLIVEWQDKRKTYRMLSIETLTTSHELELPLPNCQRELSVEEYNEHRKQSRYE